MKTEERAASEQKRLQLEQERLEEERKSREAQEKLLAVQLEQAEFRRIQAEAVASTMRTITSTVVPLLIQQSNMLNLMLELLRVIVSLNKDDDSPELDRLMEVIKSMSGNITVGGVSISGSDVKANDITGGDKITNTTTPESVASAVKTEIEAGADPTVIEMLLDVAPEIADAAVAILAGPLAAAGLAASKVAGKFKVSKKG